SYNQRVVNRNYGNPYYNDLRNYESLSRYYQTTHSLLNNDYLVSIKFRGANLIVLDKEGNFKNDYSMTIKEKDKTIMEKVSSYYYSNNGAHFFYKDEEEIFHAFRDSQNEVKKDSTLLVNSMLQDQRLRNEDDDGQVVFWYGNNFFIWGYQRISENMTNERKTVFYINKVNVN
ncbi:MAG: hypothetical protein OEW75_17275, partial [Cyclobacteriaceae bacterium]|nr:hypothetical protein [Cyclobacteriaceae bacterium]